MSSNRIISLDIARALCIVLVVIGHYYPDGCPEWWSVVRNFIYTFHMPAFMLLSGYVYVVSSVNSDGTNRGGISRL